MNRVFAVAITAVASVTNVHAQQSGAAAKTFDRRILFSSASRFNPARPAWALD